MFFHLIMNYIWAVAFVLCQFLDTEYLRGHHFLVTNNINVYFEFLRVTQPVRYCLGIVKSTRFVHMYHIPLVYVEPIAELEAVDTPPIKEPHLP